MTGVGHLHEVLVGLLGKSLNSEHFEDIHLVHVRIIFKWIFQ
jgi:hypothetical protein